MAPRNTKYEVQTTIFDSTAENDEHREQLASWWFPSDTALQQATRTWADTLKPGESFTMTVKRPEE